MSGTTPFPNDLLDKEMPHLKDSEWRILCVIVRATSGWRRKDGERKRSDWLTHTQLKMRTGRSSAAVSTAVARLVRLGLIRVTDGSGKLLPTATIRRRHQGRLYFALGITTGSTSKSEIRKVRTTKDTQTKRINRTKKGWSRASTIACTPTNLRS